MSATPPATVIGPIGGARPPAGLPTVDLAALGYVVEEFQLDGTAVGYTYADGTGPTPDGRWAPAVMGEAGYRTRILVVRPADPERFNGTVLLNWQNVSAGREGGGPNHETYHGFAWVAVSAQEIGLYGWPAGMGRGGAGGRGLVDVDPERYGELVHPGDPGSFSMFAQAARAVGPDRPVAAVDPMGGLAVTKVVATGGSQSAMRLVAYANGIHRLDPVIDGFLLSVWEGRAPRLDEGAVGFGVRTTVRSDLGTPVLVVNSEFEARNVAEVGLPDSPTVRVWEVAGTPHGVARTPDRRGDGRWHVNRLSIAPVYESALRHAHAWVQHGTVPPSQPRIEVTTDGPLQLVRDAFGNAVGGIRLPELAAPTHEHRGMTFGTGRAPLFGGSRPFTAEELASLYPSRQAYLDRWSAGVDHLVATGAIRPEDAEAMRARGDAEAPALD